VFMSGYAGHGATPAELEIADAGFLTKPLSLDALAKAVRGALDLIAKAHNA
jgi:hypothetical protein